MTYEYLGYTLLDLFIYPDGQVLWLEGEAAGRGSGYQVLEGRLSPNQICELLSELATRGYFDLRSEDYEAMYDLAGVTDYQMGAGSFSILINRPRSHWLGFESGLMDHLSPASRQIFELMERYRPPVTNYYEPDRLRLWLEVVPDEQADPAAQPWPTDLPPISELWSDRSTGEVAVEGDLVEPIMQLFDRRMDRLVFEDEAVQYAVIIRPVLPHELPQYFWGRQVPTVVQELPFACDVAELLTVTPTPLTATAAPTLTRDPGFDALTGTGKILFVTNQSGDDEIYVMNADGANPTRLTNHPADDRDPTWSPDGRQIAFSSNREGNFEIYLMSADGTDVKRLTNNPLSDESPAWSPDGSQIVFSSLKEFWWDDPDKRALYVIHPDGTDLTRLSSDEGPAYSPSWSPDGRYLAFAGKMADKNAIYILDLELDTVSYLLPGSAPSWSPDGERLAFLCGNHLCVVDRDGSNKVQISHGFQFDFSPRWSPDGDYLVYSRSAELYDLRQIHVATADGSSHLQLTGNQFENHAADWRP